MYKFIYKNIPISELLLLAQKNDYKALEELIKREQKNVYATFMYLSSDSNVVSDLTQEALINMSRSIKNLKNIKNFKSWLNQIVLNVFYDDLRKKKKRLNTISIEDSQGDDSHYLQIPDLKNKPVEKVLSQELDKIIKNKIKNLPENNRIAIVLRVFSGLSYDEIANVTKSTVGTVKSRIARAREKLQKDLANYI